LRYRRQTLEVIARAGAGHTGACLSCLEILNVLYNVVLRISPDTFASPDRDRYVQSKGHAAEALYVVLADRGFFSPDRLETLCRYSSPFAGHPTRKVPGVEQNTGALGHGLSLSVGMALAGKMDRRGYRVFTLLGDGELAEGSNWEAMMTAAHYRLDNLVVIVDRNQLQITGLTEAVCALEPLVEKLRAFGGSVRVCDGHCVSELTANLNSVPFEKDKLSVLVAHTVKGKGVSYMEGVAGWHHRVPKAEELRQALDELEAKEQALAAEAVS
jgi:transketolase